MRDAFERARPEVVELAAALVDPRRLQALTKRRGPIVDCEYGEVIRTATEEELVAAVERRAARVHPELVGKLGRDDILAMAEEAQWGPGRRSGCTTTAPSPPSADLRTPALP